MTANQILSPNANWALMVIDMQNGFCHDDGSFAKMTAERGMSIEMCKEAIPGCQRLASLARQKSRPVIYTRYTYHQNYFDGGILVEKYPDIPKSGSLAAGSWDAEIVDQLTPEPSDLVIDKSRYSAFYGTRLEPLLTGHGIDTLVMCGVTTNICVETTARDAAQRDYRVLIVSDATGELTRERHENALAILDYGFGWVVSVDDIVDLVGAE
jgi:ureidoacrylate peracid hydrolase